MYRGRFCKILGQLHKEELLLKSLITYTFIVWSTNSKMTFFLLEEKETLWSCLLKNTDFHKTHDYCLFCRTSPGSEVVSSRIPLLYIKPNNRKKKMPSHVRVTDRTFILYKFQIQFYQQPSTGGVKHICFAKWKIAISIWCREPRRTLQICKCVGGFQRWLPQHGWLFTVCGISLFQNTITVKAECLIKLCW